MASMRSCDSEVSTSNGSMPGSRVGTASRSRFAPSETAAAASLTAHVRPAPPRSLRPTKRPRSRSSRQASISSFSMNGSPICTLGLDACASSSSVALASTDTPPIPSRPVPAPISTSASPGEPARPCSSSSARANPRHITLTVGFAECAGANRTSPPTVGTPMQFPYPPMPATTPPNSQRFRGSSSGPNRSGSSSAAGRAPIASTSRTMPADAGRRALVRLDRRRVGMRFHLEHARHAVAEVDDAGVLAGSDQARAAPASGASAGASSRTCTNSVRTTSRRTSPARRGSARVRAVRRSSRARRP